MNEQPVKIKFEGIYKIFGNDPAAGMKLVAEGADKLTLLKETGMTLGINNISLDVRENEFFVIMGLSGSGKSTLIRHLNRLIDCTAGKILVDDKDVTEMNEAELQWFRRHKVSMVFQRFGLLPHKNVLENIMFGLKIRGDDKGERQKSARYWLEQVGLHGYERAYPRNLSGGMQQRVGIARALCTGTDVLIMDEPFSALDPLIRAEMQEVVLELKHKVNKTVLFVTHDLDEAVKLADRMAILKEGEVIQIGTPHEIVHSPRDEYIRRFVEGMNLGDV